MNRKPDSRSVFLNVPYDKDYEPLFVVLIATIIAIGHIPRCALLIPSQGQTRLDRIKQMISECKYSITDLCKVGTPVRFNMPFELGLIVYQYLEKPHRYKFIIFEKVKHRINISLSDVKGIDEFIHNGCQKGIIECVLDSLQNLNTMINIQDLTKYVREMKKEAEKIKKNHKVSSIYSSNVYREVIDRFLDNAIKYGFIDP
jgi:hypothetical protein